MTGCRDCAQYKKRIENLEEELALVKFEWEALRQKRYKSKKKKPPGDNEPSTPHPRKKGGLFGHIGWFRKNPKNVHRTEEVKLRKWPECGSGDIKEYENRIEEHTREDIILPKVEVTLYRKHRYYCKGCKKVILPEGKNEIPAGRAGPRAKAFAAFLRYGIKISKRDVSALFRKAFNLDISSSSIDSFMDQLKKEAKHIYNELLASLKESPFIHADETGWRLDGENHYTKESGRGGSTLPDSHIEPSA